MGSGWISLKGEAQGLTRNGSRCFNRLPSFQRKRRAVRGIEFGCSIAASSTESAEFGGMGFEENPLSAL